MEFMRLRYQPSKFAGAIDYIDSLLSIKHRFVHFIVDRHLHLGEFGNSRFGGLHSALKNDLGVDGNLVDAAERARSYLLVQATEIASELARESFKLPVDLPPICDPVSSLSFTIQRRSELMIRSKATCLGRHLL
jgi:hypothetical protein